MWGVCQWPSVLCQAARGANTEVAAGRGKAAKTRRAPESHVTVGEKEGGQELGRLKIPLKGRRWAGS